MASLLIDLDGVLYQGDEPVAGAAEAVSWMRARGVKLLFLTNTTSRPRGAIVDKLAGFGIDVSAEEILTPPLAARAWLEQQRLARVALFVPEATAAEFAGLEVLPGEAEQGADAVVVGDLGDGWTFAELNRAFRLLMAQPQPALVALGMTRYWRAPDGLRLDTAPFVVALEHAAGVEAVVLGKPSAEFFEAALHRVGARAEDSFMIGDDVRTDVGGSQAAGIRGLLVRTGKFQMRDLEGDVTPHAVLDSVAALPEWWRQHVGA